MYGEISESIKERLDFELEVIEKTDIQVILIVEDFIRRET